MASTRLNMPNGVDASATTITVHVNHMMPQAPFYCTFETGETVKVTTGSGLLDQWTIERGALNTIARPHANDEWLTVCIGHEQALAAELATSPDATTTAPGVMLADVAPLGEHPVALTTDSRAGRFSGAFYHDVSGITISAGAAGIMPAAPAFLFLAGDRYYDTDNYLQSGTLVAPFDGYYRLTGFAFSDQATQDEFLFSVQGGDAGSDFSITGHGTVADGINTSVAETFYMHAGDFPQVVFGNQGASDKLMYLWLQIDYLGR